MSDLPIIHYPSLAAFRAAVDLPRLPGAPDTSMKHPKENTWDFGIGWDGAQELARAGWPQGAAKSRALAEKIRDALEPPEMLAPSFEVAPFGENVALDMGRFVDGDPEHWRISTIKRGGHVTVAVSVTQAWHVDAEWAARRAAVGLAIAWVLHDAGYEVDLRAMMMLDLGDTDRPFGCTWQMPLEPFLTSFWIGHPAAYRRMGFRWMEAHCVEGTREAYGRMSLAAERASLPPRAVHIPTLNTANKNDYSTDEAAQETARKLLASLGSLDPTH